MAFPAPAWAASAPAYPSAVTSCGIGGGGGGAATQKRGTADVDVDDNNEFPATIAESRLPGKSHTAKKRAALRAKTFEALVSGVVKLSGLQKREEKKEKKKEKKSKAWPPAAGGGDVDNGGEKKKKEKEKRRRKEQGREPAAAPAAPAPPPPPPPHGPRRYSPSLLCRCFLVYLGLGDVYMRDPSSP